nr:MAG: VP3 [Gokushovirinae sp.]
MMMFKTQYDSHARVHLNPGSRVKTVFSPRYDDRGVLDLQVTGEEDLYGYIQSHAESCDIHCILDRFASGETDVLSQVQGFYADTAGMPKTYAEILNSVIAGEEAFNKLPADIKQRFGNSFAEWLTAMDQPDFNERMGFKPLETDQEIQDFASSTPSPAPAPASPAPASPAPSPALSLNSPPSS